MRVNDFSHFIGLCLTESRCLSERLAGFNTLSTSLARGTHLIAKLPAPLSPGIPDYRV